MIRNPSHGEIDLGTRVVPYRIVPSTRARSLRLRVGPRPEVTIVVPRGRALRNVSEILLPSRDWILRQLEKLDGSLPRPLGPGTHLPFLGREYPLVIHTGGPRPRIKLSETELVATVPATEPNAVRDALEAWYRGQARSILTARVEKIESVMGVRHERIAIRDQKTRWGSCSSRGNLNFNWRLIMAPLSVIDYVVVHELAHLIELNHSPRFWEIVARHAPEHREHRRWLRLHGPRLALVLAEDGGGERIEDDGSHEV